MQEGKIQYIELVEEFRWHEWKTCCEPTGVGDWTQAK